MPEAVLPPPPVVAGATGCDRILCRIGPLRVTVRRLAVALAVLAVGATLCLGGRHFDPGPLRDHIETLSGPGFIAACTLLPLVGFPVSWLHLLAGVRFDFSLGLLVVGLTTLGHTLLAALLVAILPDRSFRRLARWRKRLSRTGHIEATIFCTMVPGVPYTLHLYLLPLLGVPLRIFTGLGVPIHTARAVVTLLLGDATKDPTPGRLLAIGTYYLVLFATSVWVGRKLRDKLWAKPTRAVVRRRR